MKKRTKYEEAPEGVGEAIKSSRRVKDILPPPDKLVKKEETVKVTISLSKRSVNFFKEISKREGIPYQSMIKSLIDRYADYYGNLK